MNFFVVILITLFFPFLTIAATPTEYANKLTMQWPPAACKYLGEKEKTECSASARKIRSFCIHGLWPDTPKGPQCKGKPDDSVSEALKQQPELGKKMVKAWPTLLDGAKDQDLWVHEWTEHGVCTLPLMTVTQYFENTIKLYYKLPRTLDILRDADIKPGQFFSEQDLQLKLNGAKYKPAIVCKEVADGSILLTEVKFCVDPTGTAIQECDNAQLLGCGKAGKYIDFI